MTRERRAALQRRLALFAAEVDRGLPLLVRNRDDLLRAEAERVLGLKIGRYVLNESPL